MEKDIPPVDGATRCPEAYNTRDVIVVAEETVDSVQTQFQMSQPEIKGHMLSENAIGAAQSKTDALENIC